jgi:hypothetical protein
MCRWCTWSWMWLLSVLRNVLAMSLYRVGIRQISACTSDQDLTLCIALLHSSCTSNQDPTLCTGSICTVLLHPFCTLNRPFALVKFLLSCCTSLEAFALVTVALVMFVGNICCAWTANPSENVSLPCCAQTKPLGKHLHPLAAP